MIKLLKTEYIKEVNLKEAILTKEQGDLFLENEEEFLKKYGESLVWKDAEEVHKIKNWYSIFTDSETH